MFYDLHVPWSANDTQLPRTLHFLYELGYNVIALNHTISGKLPTDLRCPIPDPLPFKDLPAALTILRRCTLILTESYQNARLAELSRNYDLLAVRPVDERTLQLACSSLDCDVISLDLTQRFPFWLSSKYKMLGEAVKSGKKLEICYAQAVSAGNSSEMRRNVISNATQLIRGSRGRGVIISSEAKVAVACRGPWDAVNLATIWGLSQEKGHEAVSKECRTVVVTAKLKRTSYRGVIDVVYGGEKPVNAGKDDGDVGRAKGKRSGLKRKADALQTDESPVANGEDGQKPISKTQLKKHAKQAVLKAAGEKQHPPGNGIEDASSDAQTASTPIRVPDGNG